MFKLVLALVAAFGVAIFAVQNANPVDVIFFNQEFSISLAVVILGATLVGALIVFLLGLVQQIGWLMKLREYRRQVQELEQQLEEMQLPAAAADAQGATEAAAAGLEPEPPAAGETPEEERSANAASGDTGSEIAVGEAEAEPSGSEAGEEEAEDEENQV